jgi:hypothetical protein
MALYDYWYRLSSDKLIGNKGAYYVPRFTMVPVKTVGKYKDMYMAYAATLGKNEEVDADEAVDGAVGEALNAELVSEV